MSLEALAAAFKADLPPREKLTLLVLADYAGTDGENMDQFCWPGVRTLMRHTSLSQSGIQRSLGALQAAGAIESVGIDSRYGTRIWRLNLEGLASRPRPSAAKSCPVQIRRLTIAAFEMVCSYCGGAGNDSTGPDGRSWSIDRVVPGSRGGEYVAENVTLSCHSCNSKKGAKDFGSMRTLAEVLDERDWGVQPEPGGSTGTREGVQLEPVGGFRLNPEPLLQPSEEPENFLERTPVSVEEQSKEQEQELNSKEPKSKEQKNVELQIAKALEQEQEPKSKRTARPDPKPPARPRTPRARAAAGSRKGSKPKGGSVPKSDPLRETIRRLY